MYLLDISTDDGHTKPQPRKGTLPDPTEYKCLVRASLGNKKISTVVSIFLLVSLILSTLGKNFSRQHFERFFSSFSRQ